MGIVITAIVVILVLAGIAVAAKRHNEKKTEARRNEARDTRAYARVAQLEADRRAAEAEERAAGSKREGLAAEQQRLAAAAQRSSAQDLQARADEIDPDV